MLYFFCCCYCCCVFVYGAKMHRKKLKKNLFAIVFVISFAIRVRWVLRLWCLCSCGGRSRPGACVRWWSLSLWLLCSGSGCILHYFANVSKMGAHPRTHAPTHPRAYTYTHTRAIIFRPAIFRLSTEIFSPEIFGCLIAIFRRHPAIFTKK